MKQLILRTGLQIAQGCDPWKKGNIWSASKFTLAFCLGHFPSPRQGNWSTKSGGPSGQRKEWMALGLLKWLELSLDLLL